MNTTLTAMLQLADDLRFEIPLSTLRAHSPSDFVLNAALQAVYDGMSHRHDGETMVSVRGIRGEGPVVDVDTL